MNAYEAHMEVGSVLTEEILKPIRIMNDTFQGREMNVQLDKQFHLNVIKTKFIAVYKKLLCQTVLVKLFIKNCILLIRISKHLLFNPLSYDTFIFTNIQDKKQNGGENV